MSTVKITDAYLTHLRDHADKLRNDAGHRGAHDDGGSGRILEQICAYTAGRDGKIPAFWVEDLKAFVKKNDAEYSEYQRLKQKFES